MLLVFTTVLFSTMSVLADEVTADIGPTILNGHLASLGKIEMVHVAQNSNSSHPTAHTQLVATVVYSSICQTPASFVVIRNGDGEDFSVIEAHAPPRKDRLTCQARNRVEMPVQVTEFYGELPKLELIRVNGLEVGTK